MLIDVAELRDFYNTGLGLTVRRIVGHRIRARWRPKPDSVVMGLGFASPYLKTFVSESTRVGALMPEGQGALVWPSDGPVRAVLVEEDCLPLPDNSVDRMLLVHCLEVATRAEVMMREIWRVLSPEGSLFVIVPNRRGVWARLDTTPFGVGRPFSRSQLEKLLINSMFRPVDWTGALHIPPFDRKIVLKSALAMERLGSAVSPAFAGLMMVEARKEMTAPIIKPARKQSLRGLVQVPGGGRLVLNK